LSHPTCDVPVTPRRPGEYWKGMIPACLLYQGVRDRFGIPKPRESGSVIGADRRRSGLVGHPYHQRAAAQRRPKRADITKAHGHGLRGISRGTSAAELHFCSWKSWLRSRRHILGPERPEAVWSLLCVAETRSARPNGEWWYITRRQCWATSAQRRCHPEEALYSPTFSHLI